MSASKIFMGLANVIAGTLDFFEACEKGESTADALAHAIKKASKRAKRLKGTAPLTRKRPFIVEVCPCGSGAPYEDCHPDGYRRTHGE